MSEQVQHMQAGHQREHRAPLLATCAAGGGETEDSDGKR
jgi:hypothetical protein